MYMSSLMKLAFNALSKNQYHEILQDKSYITYGIVYEMGNEQRKKNVEKMKIWANSIVNIKISSELKNIMDLMDTFLSKEENFLFQDYITVKFRFNAWKIFIKMLEGLFNIIDYIEIDEKYLMKSIWTKENWLIYKTFCFVYEERISNEEFKFCNIPQYIQNAKNSKLYPFLIYKYIDYTMNLHDLHSDGY